MNAEPQSSGGEVPQRDPVKKAEGVTVAEKYLARLCERSFLSLWSYPSVFRDQGKQGVDGHGKEVCDLLVVFDRNIIVFSDKHCELLDSGDVQCDWRRWFRKAIQKSAEQAWGAERWIRQHPDRMFLDRDCKHPVPIDLPQMEQATFHLVVVAHGVSQRIRKEFPTSSGSLMLDTSIKGFDKHTTPFFVGDLAPQKTFVHILDDDSLRTLMLTRDTVSDFVEYLSARKSLLRGQRDICATGEEELLAIYLKNLNGDGVHDFVFPIQPGQTFSRIHLPEGHWEQFQSAPERLAQVKADRVSYTWDRLIEKFGFYALRGEQYFVTDGGIKDSERVLRFMARESRWKRRYLAEAILDMLHTTPVDKRRLQVLPPVQEGDPYYVFLLLPTHHAKTADEYRTVRQSYLQSCCAVTKLAYPEALDIVGIATEPGVNNASRSEDAIYFDARVWNTDMESKAREHQERLGILKTPRRIVKQMQEYPAIPLFGAKGKNQRNKPCPCGSGMKSKHCCFS